MWAATYRLGTVTLPPSRLHSSPRSHARAEISFSTLREGMGALPAVFNNLSRPQSLCWGRYVGCNVWVLGTGESEKVNSPGSKIQPAVGNRKSKTTPISRKTIHLYLPGNGSLVGRRVPSGLKVHPLVIFSRTKLKNSRRASSGFSLI